MLAVAKGHAKVGHKLHSEPTYHSIFSDAFPLISTHAYPLPFRSSFTPHHPSHLSNTAATEHLSGSSLGFPPPAHVTAPSKKSRHVICHIDSTTHRKAWLPCWGAKAAAEVAQRAVRARESLTMVAMEQPKSVHLSPCADARWPNKKYRKRGCTTS